MRYSLTFLIDYMSAKGITLRKIKGGYILENPELKKSTIAAFANKKDLESYIRRNY